MRATTQITRLCTRDGSAGLDVATAPNEADISQRFASSAEYRARHKKQRDSDTKRCSYVLSRDSCDIFLVSFLGSERMANGAVCWVADKTGKVHSDEGKLL